MGTLKAIGAALMATVPTVAGIGTYAYMRNRRRSGQLMSLGASAAAVAIGNIAAGFGLAALAASEMGTFSGIGADYYQVPGGGYRKIGNLAPFNQYIPPVATKAFGQLITPGDVQRANYFTGLGMQTVPRVVKHDWARN